MSDLQKELEPFPDEAGLSFVGSVDDGGFPQVKAMLAPRGREGLRVFRFSTNASSMRVAQFRRNGAACLYFCDPRTFRGLLLTGTMEVLEDAASRRLVWREGDERYYPRRRGRSGLLRAPVHGPHGTVLLRFSFGKF